MDKSTGDKHDLVSPPLGSFIHIREKKRKIKILKILIKKNV